MMAVGDTSVLLIAMAIQGASAQSSAPISNLPLNLPFSITEIEAASADEFVMSPSGSELAVVLRDRSQSLDHSRAFSTRIGDNGTPNNAVGLRIHLVDLRSRQTTRLCEGVLGRGDSWRPSWAPDGSRLAFYSNASGRPRLWLYESDTRTCRMAADVDIAAHLWGGDEPQWDGPRRLIVPARMEQPANETEPRDRSGAPTVRVYFGASEATGRTDSQGTRDSSQRQREFENNSAIISVDLVTGTTHTLVDVGSSPRPNVARVSPTGGWISYLSVPRSADDGRCCVQDLVVRQATGGSAHTMASGLATPWRPEDQFTQTYRWHPVADQLVVLKSDQLWLANFSRDEVPSLVPITPEIGPLSERVLLYSPDGLSLLVGADLQSEGWGRLAAGRPATLALVGVDGRAPVRLRIGPEFEFRTVVERFDGTYYLAPDNSVFVLARDTGSGETVVLAFNSQTGNRRVLWRGLARFDNVIATSDNSLFAVFENFSTPPDIWRFSNQMRSSERVTNINSHLPSGNFGTATSLNVTVPMYDGRTQVVRTVVISPPNASRDVLPPAVVYIYPDRDYSTRLADYALRGFPFPVAALTSRGYAIVYPNIDVGPGNEPGNIGQEITDALLPQIYEASNRRLIDIRRLAIAGSSFGGFASISVVTQTNLFRAAITMNGPYDLGGNYGVFGPGPFGDSARVGWTEGSQPRIGTHPWADVRRVIANSPYYNADRVRTPVLILQGGDDIYLPEAQKLFVALRRLGRPVQLAIYRDSGHGLSSWPVANAVDAVERVLDFLDRYVARGGQLAP